MRITSSQLIQPMLFQSHYDPITGSYFQQQNTEGPLYGSLIPRPSSHEQVELGTNAFGWTVFLDTGLY